MHTFPRPTEFHLSVERVPVSGSTCPECGSGEIASYRVLSEGGWWDVRKCQACLCSLERAQAPRYGSFVPLASEL
jgi:vanillate/4-hydroxybenzoate decarboxylase subunit D